MQPDSDKDQWKQPTDRGSSAPYAPVSDDTSQSDDSGASGGPVVSLSPDAGGDKSKTPHYGDTSAADGSSATALEDDSPIVHWQASEYIHREKNVLWYVIFAVVVVLLMALALFLMHSITFVILIPVMAAALVVYSRRPPHMLDYTLSRQGLHVNDRLYAFAEFKGFAVVHGDDEYSIMLLPIKRFKPGVSVYFPEDKGEAIVDVMAARLPMEEAHLDFVDRLIKKLHI